MNIPPQPSSFVRLALVGLALACAPAVAHAAPQFQWSDHPQQGTLDLTFGEEPVLRYMYAFDTSTEERRMETFKVYHHVFGPGTGKLLTKGAGLFPHHHGMFVGWRITKFDGKSIDTWHCTNGVNLRHVKMLDTKADASSATMSSEIAWNDGQGKPVLREVRTVTVSKVPGETASDHAWQIDWKSTLKSERGQVDLDGDRQHSGFQFRAAQEVADSKGARYLRPDGFPQDPNAFEVDDKVNPDSHNNLNWLAMTFSIDGKQHTVEYFEDPALPKPSHYSERPYGRFGAFFRASVTPEKPLSMHYRLRVTAGQPPSRESIRTRYEAFVADLKHEQVQK